MENTDLFNLPRFSELVIYSELAIYKSPNSFPGSTHAPSQHTLLLSPSLIDIRLASPFLCPSAMLILPPD